MWRRKREHDLQRELDAHLDLESEEQGDFYGARRALGNLSRVKEDVREAWGWTWLERLGQDLRYALRTMKQSPGFTATAVLSLALGIGANTAIFTLIDALMLRWLPVRDPRELVQLRISSTQGPPSENLSLLEIRAFDDVRDVFAGVAGYSAATKFNAGFPESADAVWGAWVNGGFFETLGLQPVLGRLLTRADDERGAPSIAVITDAYWERKFGRDPKVIGQAVLIEGVPVMIVGVSPPGFLGATVGEAIDLAMPVSILPQIFPSRGWVLQDAGFHWMRALARPRPGVTAAQAKARLAVAWGQFAAAAEPRSNRQKQLLSSTIDVIPGGTGTSPLRREFRRPLQVLMGIVVLVLLIACANAANLLLARANTREKEIAVRLAIGAGRGRILRQLLTESALLSSLGAAVGVGAAWLSGRFLVTIVASATTNRTFFDLRPDGHVLGFACAVTLCTTLLFGLAPALHATAPGPTAGIKHHRASRTHSGSALLVLQLALSVILLMGAGLFMRTLQNLLSLDPGFRREGVLLADIDPRRAGYRDVALAGFYRDVLEDVRRIPGVVAASLSASTPLGDLNLATNITVPGQPSPANIAENSVTPEYFETMATPVVQGRGFTERDQPSAPKVAVVNEAFVRRFLADGPVVGRILSRDRDDLEIVGVVKDTLADSLRQAPRSTLFRPLMQGGSPFGATLEVRTSDSLSQAASAVRSVLQARLRTLAEVRTLTAQVEKSLVQERLMAAVASAFGALALALAAVGLFGLLAYSVTLRTKEIGIRMALGAERHRVLRSVLASALKLVVIGTALGIPGAWAASRWVKSMLFGVTPADPATIGSAASLLVAAALLAAYLPARRASRVDPMTALRHE